MKNAYNLGFASGRWFGAHCSNPYKRWYQFFHAWAWCNGWEAGMKESLDRWLKKNAA